jgi:hypothetical protein
MKKFFTVLMLAVSIPAFSQTKQPLDWKALYQQLFYWNIWKNSDRASTRHAWERAVSYTPMDANNAYDLIRNAPSSEGAVKMWKEVFGFSLNQQYLQAGIYFRNVKGIEQLYDSGAAALLNTISDERSLPSDQTKNYFDTKLGQMVMESLKDTLIVVIPGFGSHTIPDYSYPELVEAANTYYGRPTVRKATKDEATGESVYIGENSPEQFYLDRPGAPELKLDVVHALGYELGNSMTKDKDTAKYLKEWIEALPERYKDKKLVLVGYSKGAPIAHNMVQLFPSIRKRTQLILTLAGANQGSIAAQGGIDVLLRVTKSESPDEAIQKMEAKTAMMRFFVRNLLAGMTGAMTSPQQADYFSGVTGSSVLALFGLVGKTADTKDFRKALDGVIDLTNFERIKWNLLHLNDSDFDQPLTVMNFSAITYPDDFYLPGPITNGPEDIDPPLLLPQYSSVGQIDNLMFSRDAVFLQLTSILGFMQAPGGLFDTQLAWMDSKGMPLDKRSVAESLTDERMVKLAKEVKEATGFDLPAGWENMSRNELLKKFNDLRGKTMNNLNFVDLGDVRANHWDISFRQVYKPETGKYYEHKFPRKAALTALVETVAMWAKSKEPAVQGNVQENGGQP